MEQTLGAPGGGGEEQDSVTQWALPLPGSPYTRFALPAARELWLSMPEFGEKERNYLFKSYTDLE